LLDSSSIHLLDRRHDYRDAFRAARRPVTSSTATPAAEAVALGNALVRDERGALSTSNRRLRERWQTLAAHEREDWAARSVDPDTSLVTGGFEPAIDRHPV
jgi:hypothetical protein